MKLHTDAPTEDVQIQLIPLIDVIFCILTFFILAALSLTRQQAINLDLPRASTGVTQMREMLVVSISSTGQTFIDRQPVDRTQLRQALENYQRTNPDGLLVLYASQTAFYNDVVQVLDILRQVGGDRVALATIPVDPNQPGETPTSPTISPTTPGVDPSGLFNPASPGLPFNPAQPFPGAPGTESGTGNPVPLPSVSPSPTKP
jgi:biopolymer transport protein ExbD